MQVVLGSITKGFFWLRGDPWCCARPHLPVACIMQNSGGSSTTQHDDGIARASSSIFCFDCLFRRRRVLRRLAGPPLVHHHHLPRTATSGGTHHAAADRWWSWAESAGTTTTATSRRCAAASSLQTPRRTCRTPRLAPPTTFGYGAASRRASTTWCVEYLVHRWETLERMLSRRARFSRGAAAQPVALHHHPGGHHSSQGEGECGA